MKYKNTKEEIEKAIKESISWREACRKLGRVDRTGNATYLKKKATELEIDSSHFLGQAHNKGQCFKKKSVKEYCFEGSKVNSHKLKNVLIRDGIKEAKCEICNISEWMGQPVVLELDHIDSDHRNNELKNLQILCPNCHALETRKRINEKKKIKTDGRKIRNERISTRKIKNRPDIQLLKNSVEVIGYRATGRIYNVSDNCIRKWIRQGEVLELVDIPVLEIGAK